MARRLSRSSIRELILSMGAYLKYIVERQFHLLLRAVRSKAVNQVANEFLG